MLAALDFLIATERSGSNLLTRMLDSHPEVCGPTPSHLVRTFSRNLLRYGDLRDDRAWNALTDDVAALLDCQLGRWRTRWAAEQLRAAIRERSLVAIIRQVYAAEAEAQGKTRVFVKENRTHTFLSFLLAAFPEARFVLLVRDPRDVALSWKRSANHPGGVRRAASVWHDDQRENLVGCGFLRAAARIHLLRYEDLLADPERALRPLCDFLGVRFDARLLEFHRQPATVENAGRIKDWENLGRPVLADNSQKFRASLDPAEVRYVEAICREEMETLGYACEHPPGDPADFERRLLEIEQAEPPPHDDLPAAERELRERRLAVIHRIRRRSKGALDP